MVCFLFLWFLLFPALANATEEAVLLLSAELKPYLEFAEGFRNIAQETRFFILPQEETLVRHYLHEHSERVVAVGSKALRFLRDFTIKEVFYSLVVSPEIAARLLPDRKLCGLYLRLPPEVTLPHLKKILLEDLGLQREPLVVLLPYSNRENDVFAKNAQEIGKKLGFFVEPVFVERVAHLRTILWKEDFDLLYCIPDPLFATEEAISLVLRLALLRGKAACGYNRFFLEKGALVSFVFDYRKVGEEAARRWLARDCGPAPAPFELLVNEKVLKFLRQKISTSKFENLKNEKNENEISKEATPR